MGLAWSNVTVKNGNLIVCFTAFPTNDNLKNDIWNLWKAKKDELKEEGFGIGKDPKTGVWKINYFHNVTDTSYEKTIDGKHMWKHHFDAKLIKWEKYVNETKQVTPVKKYVKKPVSKDEEDIIIPDDEGDDDVDPELINGLLNKFTKNI